jgi:hypothetical protein
MYWNKRHWEKCKKIWLKSKYKFQYCAKK